MNNLWTEKYRPNDADSFCAPDHIRLFLKNALKDGYPHLLLYGPPGAGKTTFAHILAKGRNTLELNASDSRGIDVVRTSIKDFALSISTENVVILDECEVLTRDAQHCLRRVIEDCPNTRFIFTTNYLCKIIEPLRSRLVKIGFGRFDSRKVISDVCESEGLKFLDVDKLYKCCAGDIRRCINVLQSISPLEEYNLDEFFGRVSTEILDRFWSIDFGRMRQFVLDFVRYSYSCLQFIYQIAENLKGTDIQKAAFSDVLSRAEECSMVGCSDEIVVNFLCCKKIELYGDAKD